MLRHQIRPLFTLTGFLALGVLACGINLASSRGQTRKAAEPKTAELHLDHPDTVCRGCHQAIYDLYEQTPMAQASGLAVDGLAGAELSAPDLVHKQSGVTYHLSIRDRQAYLHYSRPASSVRAALDGQYRLDFFIGSGHRGRTYLYNLNGLWFETPINWYGKMQMWDMAPAYDNARSMPNQLPVDPNCLHCHAGDVEPSIGPARNRYAAQPFRSAGIGCSACHGDPTLHLSRTSLTHDQPDTGSLHSTPVLKSDSASKPLNIVNPSKLDPSRRDSICLQCHLEGDAAVYLPGKSLQAFKAGEDLSESVSYFIDSTRAQLGLRATSQYEALLRSACKRATGDRLTCTTCHDPHSSPTPATRVAYFRARCLTCHTGVAIATSHHPEQQDCAACHMPTRKTSDISHEQLTDHNIQALTSSAQTQSSTTLHGPASLVPIAKISAPNRELGLAYAQLAEHGDRASGQQALALLLKAEQAGTKDPETLDQLGFLLQVSGSSIAAAERYRSALQQNPRDIIAQSNLAVIVASMGQTGEAVHLLSKAFNDDPSKVASGLNLAFLQCRAGNKVDALKTVEQVLHYNPDSVTTHHFLETGDYGNQHCAID